MFRKYLIITDIICLYISCKRTVGLAGNWNLLLPELPESPYMYNTNDRKVQRVRKRKISKP